MRLLVQILSLLPLRGLYVLSDFLLYPLMYYVMRYRRKIVAKNLRNAFPEKTAAERKAIEKGYYHHLADVIVEIIWSFRATPEVMKQHYIIPDMSKLEDCIREKGGVYLMLGHLGNWEWTPEVEHHLTDKNFHHYNVCGRQKDGSVDKVMLEIREKRSGKGSCFYKKMLARHLVELKQKGVYYSLGMLSDQKPQPRNSYHWTTFLNQDTAFLGGGEVLSKKFDKAVGYGHIRKLSRGVYEASFILITKNPQETETGWITEQYARLLEQNIMEQPELWLWSHNRWKWKRGDK